MANLRAATHEGERVGQIGRGMDLSSIRDFSEKEDISIINGDRIETNPFFLTTDDCIITINGTVPLQKYEAVESRERGHHQSSFFHAWKSRHIE